MNRRKALEILVEYFIKKERLVGEREYRKSKDIPIRPTYISRYIGPWSRIPNLVKHNYPDVYELLTSEKPKKEESVKISIPMIKDEVPDELEE